MTSRGLAWTGKGIAATTTRAPEVTSELLKERPPATSRWAVGNQPEVDPVSLVRFDQVLLTKAAVAQFEEILA